MQERLEHPKVSTTIGHQCRYGLLTPSPTTELMPAMEPTGFASTSPQMLARLSNKCLGDHEHQQLVEGRGAAAAFYPPALIQAMLRGIRDTADAEARREPDPDGPHELPCAELVHAVVRAEHLADAEPELATHLQAQKIKRKLDRMCIPFRHADGRTERLPLH